MLADRCNADKSDHLAAPDHLDRWARREHDHSAFLAEVADAARWPSEPRRSRALLASTYGNIAPGTPLWLQGNRFVDAAGPIAIPG